MQQNMAPPENSDLAPPEEPAQQQQQQPEQSNMHPGGFGSERDML